MVPTRVENFVRPNHRRTAKVGPHAALPLVILYTNAASEPNSTASFVNVWRFRGRGKLLWDLTPLQIYLIDLQLFVPVKYFLSTSIILALCVF